MVRAMGIGPSSDAFWGPLVQRLREQRGDFTPGSPWYVPPAAGAASATPKPGSTVTVLGTPPRASARNAPAGASSPAPSAVATPGTGKTLLGQ
jgi:hypothetical protein